MIPGAIVRQTEDGFVVESRVQGVRLTVAGLSCDPVPLTLVVECTRCGAELSRREYGDPKTPEDAPPSDLLEAHAVLDATRAGAHACLLP